jgi:hypothetical protein
MDEKRLKKVIALGLFIGLAYSGGVALGLIGVIGGVILAGAICYYLNL